MSLLRSSLVATLLLSSLLSLSAVEIIAHRGASKDAPENTLSSLRLGYAQGAVRGNSTFT